MRKRVARAWANIEKMMYQAGPSARWRRVKGTTSAIVAQMLAMDRHGPEYKSLEDSTNMIWRMEEK